MQDSRPLPCGVFDHVLWLLEAADGTRQRARIVLGEAVLLFTSLDSLNDYLNRCDDPEKGKYRPVVFSRSRKEFGRQARKAVRDGVVGALFDPNGRAGEAPFLPFRKTHKTHR